MAQENLKIRIAINTPPPTIELIPPPQSYNWPLIAAALLSLGFIAFLIIAQFSPQTPKQTEERSVPLAHLENIKNLSPQKSATVASIKAPQAVEQNIAIETPAENIKRLPPQKSTMPASIQTPQTIKQVIAIEAPTEAIIQAPQTVQLIKPIPAITRPTTSPKALAESATITTSHTPALPDFLKRVQLSTKIVRREPVDSLNSPIPLIQLPENRLYFFTEIIGKSGQTLHHRWLYKNKVMVNIPIKVNSPRWRFYSSKHVNKDFLGEWLLEVIDDQGNRLYQQTVQITAQ